jgi:predicted AAA+ superfamily ATPase
MIFRLCKLPETQSFFLFGPRGCGKSTLLRSHFQNKDTLWIDLLDQSTELQLAIDPDSLLTRWKSKKTDWIVIDEVQKIPKILDVVHKGIEAHKIKFALTGSSARNLKRGGANLLAGRAVERQLQSFSSIELGNKFRLDRAIKFGTLPKIWDEELPESEAADFLNSYVSTYLREEVAAEQLVRNLDPFRRFLVAAAQSNAKIINHSAIERDAGIPRKQSERHFEILADTLIGNYLHPFHNSIRRRQTQKAKFYFFDTGVVRAIQRLTEFELESATFEYGNLFETMIINEFFKISSALKKNFEFSYLQAGESREIDLIVELPRGKPFLIEIKSSRKFDRKKVSALFDLKKEIPHSRAFVLSNDPTRQEVEGVDVVHWLEGLKEIFEIH